MQSNPSYLAYISDQLSALDGISHRAMTGEFILYIHGRIFGGIYDDRLLVKPTPAARRMMPSAPAELPYPGAKEMLLVEQVDDREFLCALVAAMEAELPEPKKKIMQSTS